MATIDEEIQQSHWHSPLQRAMVNLIYTSHWVEAKMAQFLKEYQLTQQQFNILRILRGCKGEPATVRLLTSRMIDKSSNASRLVDKLVAKDLVLRGPSKVDRRETLVEISPKGLQILERIDKRSSEMHNFIGNLNEDESNLLCHLLDKARGPN